ncbi:hypothetical protein QQS21_004125 [Conoideocrella luteorostrata]|uniref:Protein-arginine deiminase C-terminal domain-containing protein n=1 Tax=Conoideocrella luteorostrata TaxID=1105319 RepID=A0AAJ0CS04_9HYPO|nr:hypothetical protein QQS21_004125 [Conoideocrella luteorostrata]
MRLALLCATLPLSSMAAKGTPTDSASSKSDGPLPSRKVDDATALIHSQTSASSSQSTAASTPQKSGNELKVTTLADSNRDGKVDVTGETDLSGKNEWSEESDAKLREYENFEYPKDADKRIDHCNDASDEALRNSACLAPFRTKPIPKTIDSAHDQNRNNGTAAPPERESKILTVLETGTLLEISGQHAAYKADGVKESRRGRQVVGLTALYPSAINSIVLNNNGVLAPNPWGPKVDGKDVLTAIVRVSNYANARADHYFSRDSKSQGSEAHLSTFSSAAGRQFKATKLLC